MSDETTLQLYTEMLLARLPLGDASIWRGAVMVSTCRALAGDGARVKSDAMDMLNGFMPDTANEQGLQLWEAIMLLNADDLSLQQRREQVMARLRGSATPTEAHLTSILQQFVSADNYVKRTSGVDGQASARADLLEPVLGSGYPEDQSYFLLEDATYDGPAFGRYGGEASSYTLAAGTGKILVGLPGTSADSFRVTFSLKAAGGSASVQAQYHTPGGWVTAYSIALTPSAWTDIVMEIPAGSTTPAWRLMGSPFTPQSITVSWVINGKHDPALERAVREALQIPAHVTFQVGNQRESGA